VPELPEVETTRRGIAPHIEGKTVRKVVVRQRRLRWPIYGGLEKLLPGQRVRRVERRAKYLLLRLDQGTLIVHLGMSGSLRIVPSATAAEAHDHFDLVFPGQTLRLRDPRRFGAVLWTRQPPEQHPLLRHLGPEPLADAFNGDLLYNRSRGRKVAVKNLLMDGKVVVGVGNIYANESMFLAGIHPNRSCNRISRERYQTLAAMVKQVLKEAIRQGGTTLRDFQQGDGQPGYFAQQLLVYGKEGEPCPNCGRPIKQSRIGQRSSFFCSHCQR
jgi:formamidopyrimidine-DNA glycosylase